MAIEARRPFTADEYFAMFHAGILTEDDRVELLDGEIVLKPVANPRHGGSVSRLTQIFVLRLAGQAVISPQNTIRLSKMSAPEPDIAVLAWREDFYTTKHAVPDDVLLAIEVADTTVRDDRRVKVPLYARARLREVWLVEINGRFVEVWRDPWRGRYRTVRRAGPGETVAALAFPDFEIAVDDILP